MVQKTKTSKRIRTIVYVVIFSLIVSFFAFLLICKLQNRVSYVFGKAPVWIVSPSMTGVFDANSYILVEEIDGNQVQVGDVIMFYSDDPTLQGGLNTHRVLEIVGDNQEFITKGDNNNSRDSYTAKSDKVIGRYVKNLPVMTAIIRFFLTTPGFITVIVIVLAITAFAFSDEIRKYLASEKNKAIEEKEKEKQRLIQEEIEKLKNNKGE